MASAITPLRCSIEILSSAIPPIARLLLALLSNIVALLSYLKSHNQTQNQFAKGTPLLDSPNFFFILRMLGRELRDFQSTQPIYSYLCCTHLPASCSVSTPLILTARDERDSNSLLVFFMGVVNLYKLIIFLNRRSSIIRLSFFGLAFSEIPATFSYESDNAALLDFLILLLSPMALTSHLTNFQEWDRGSFSPFPPHIRLLDEPVAL